jgi:hypothetical protein
MTFPKGKPPTFIEITVGGTSMASPLLAGIIADAQQRQHTVFGFTDPVLYRLNGTPALHDILPSTSHTPGLFRGEVCNVAFCRALGLITFDDQSPIMAGYTGQVTLKGYDNMTGIGTPRGQAFISALRKLVGCEPPRSPRRSRRGLRGRRPSTAPGGARRGRGRLLLSGPGIGSACWKATVYRFVATEAGVEYTFAAGQSGQLLLKAADLC